MGNSEQPKHEVRNSLLEISKRMIEMRSVPDVIKIYIFK